jgi:hypothetical protein
VGIFGSLFGWFAKLSVFMQLVIAVLLVGFGIIMLFIIFALLVWLSGPAAAPQPTRTPGATATLAPATSAPAATTPGQATGTIPPEDTRLVPPEDFTLVVTADGMHTVSWVWPSGQELDPTFFRVSVQGQPNDFDFTGPGDYEVEVPAVCGSNPNFMTLDAFNTDVEPEANSQAEELIQADPGC